MRDGRPRVRVGFVGERADFFGGGQRSLLDLVLAVRDAGVEPLVILPGPGALAAAFDAAGVRQVPLRLPAVRRLPAAIGALRRLAGLARRHDLGILHSDAPRAALYAGLAARLAGRRHVWHLRASVASRAVVDHLLLALSDAVIAVSRAAAARSAALRRSGRVRVVPTGIRPAESLGREEARAALGLPPGRFIAVVVGRVEPDKGGEDAVDALPAIRAACPGAMLAFLGAEDPASPWRERLAGRAAAAGLSAEVLFLGERAEAARHLAAFDLLLHPSRHEALPRVLIEALFALLPVVAAAVGGVPEVIENGRSGLLVPPRDPAALGAAAASLARDPRARVRLAEQGRARARAHFGLERMSRAVLALYDEVLTGAGPEPTGAREAAP
jgi:glycosyltransferase involved in cell wall biosynthesis